MSQKMLPFGGAKVLVRLCDSDREFFRATPLNEIPVSFWIMTRALRLNCHEFELSCMRSYELSRELAEEVAIAGLGLRWFTIAPPTILHQPTIDAIARREALERAALFKEFLASR